MKLHHVRHATSVLTYAGLKILLDPCLSAKGALPPITMTPLRRPNPLVDLAMPIESLLTADVVLATHLHQDHFDLKAAEVLDKAIPIICQAENTDQLKDYGFQELYPISKVLPELDYKGIHLRRTYAQHGFGTTGETMGTTSGYILSASGEPTLYITGDTVFNDEIRHNIETYKPDIFLINAGSPKFLGSDRIVMNIQDLEKTLEVRPQSTFVIVHLDAFNHCIETRDDLKLYFNAAKLENMGVRDFIIPNDNEMLTL